MKLKKAVFITTKNLDYLRNVQEIEKLKEKYDVTIIGFLDRSYLKRMVKIFLRLFVFDFKDVDTVFVGFAPQLIIPFWWWKFKNKYTIIDFFISLYDTMVFDRGVFKKASLVARVLKKIDELTIGRADHIIADTKAHGQYFVDEFHANPEKMEILYLNADESIYYPRKAEKPENYKNKFIVLYFGSVLPLQGVEIILQAASYFKDDTSIVFEIIGPIGQKYHKPQNDNIVYYPWLQQKDLAEHIAYADLCLAGHFNARIMKAKRTIPGKAYIYKAMGKEMVLGDNLANHELFDEQQKGIYFVEMGNAEALADKIKAVKTIYKNRRE